LIEAMPLVGRNRPSLARKKDAPHPEPRIRCRSLRRSLAGAGATRWTERSIDIGVFRL
jgi:hypothetical protein